MRSSVRCCRIVTFQVKEHEAVGIIGANGVGKSTLLGLLVGLNTEYEGSIRVEGVPVEKKTLPQIREKMGYIFPGVGQSVIYAECV